MEAPNIALQLNACFPNSATLQHICLALQLMGSAPFLTCMQCGLQASAAPAKQTRHVLLQTHLHRCAKAFSSPPRWSCKRAVSQLRASTAQDAPASAKVAVEQGLEAFAKGNSTEALKLFRKGLSMNPTKDEARAALYNSACCLVKEKQWQAAADAVTDACNNYGLKYVVTLKVSNWDSRHAHNTTVWV